MHSGIKIAITLTLLVLLGGMGIADYYWTDGRLTADVTMENTEDTEDSEGTERTEENEEETIAAETGTIIVPPEGAVAKNQGPTIEEIALEQGLEMRTTDDLNLLTQITEEGTRVQSVVLLKNGDRAGTVAWTESHDIKTTYALLKDALIITFSPQMTDLRDETIQEADLPVRNLLTFMDPALSEERILFIRVRDRLFEFHIATKNEAAMVAFVDSLTKR